MMLKKISILFLLIFLVFETASSQVPISNRNPAAALVNASNESVFVHTDRDAYVAGENLLFKVYLNTTDTANRKQVSKIAYLILRDKKNVKINLAVQLENGNSFSCIYLPDTMKTGMYQFVAFTNYMRNFSENYFFYKTIFIINRFDKILSDFQIVDSLPKNKNFRDSILISNSTPKSFIHIDLEKDSFKVREMIKCKINLIDPSINFANLSISIKEISPLGALMDSLEITARNFISTKNTWPYLHEQNGIYLRGHVVTKDNQPISNERLFLSSPDSMANLQYTMSDDGGNFLFLLNNYYLGKELFVKLRENNPNFQGAKIIFEDKFALQNPFEPVLPLITRQIKRSIFRSQDMVQIQKSYSSVNVKFLTGTNQEDPTPYVYRVANFECVPADFIPLNDFQDISANLLPPLKLRKQNDKFEAYVYNELTKFFYPRPATIFVDGVPIDDINQILSFKSEDIRKIEICRVPKIMGEIEFTGILSIITKKLKINTIELNSPAVTLKIDRLIDKALLEPPSILFSKISSFSPDFRQTLYWRPNIQVKKRETQTLEFNASDNISEYRIEIRGFSIDGQAITAFKKIKVYR